MTIVATKFTPISSGEFREIHYTVTGPTTSANMGGFGVHLTLVRHGDKGKKKKNRIHIYFQPVNGRLKLIEGISNRHPIMDGYLYQEWRKEAYAFFEETCAKHNLTSPEAKKEISSEAPKYNEAFPGLPSMAPKKPTIPTPVSSAVTAVALPVNSSMPPLDVFMPQRLSDIENDTIRRVLEECGAFD